MSILRCPYRGAVIDGLLPDGPAQVCNHPEVRGPCALKMNPPIGITPCLKCTRWHSSPEQALVVIGDLPPLDPCTFEPPPPPPPKHPGSVRCVHMGEATGETADCKTCKGTRLKVFACDIYGSCTLEKPGQGIGAICKGCPDYQRGIVMNCNQHGAGDAMLVAWIAEAQKNCVALMASDERKQLLEMLGQKVIEGGRPENFGKIDSPAFEKSVSAVCYAMGVEQKWSRPPVTVPASAAKWAEQRIGDLRMILLAPKSAAATREWPSESWRSLAESLLDKGFSVAVCGEAWPDLRIINVPKGWDYNAAVMQRAEAVVCSDSGPMHLAGTMNRPTLALLGPTTEQIASHMPSVHCLFTEQRLMPCTGCWWKHPDYSYERCGTGCESLAMLTPATVIGRIEQLLSEARCSKQPATRANIMKSTGGPGSTTGPMATGKRPMVVG